MSKMNPEIKAKWVAALRSGNYQQGRGELRSAKNCFCCLGVLCDIRDPNKWVEHEEYPEEGPFGYEKANDFDYPPRSLMDWAGIDWFETHVTIDGLYRPLADHNDNGTPFRMIADAIEAQL